MIFGILIAWLILATLACFIAYHYHPYSSVRDDKSRGAYAAWWFLYRWFPGILILTGFITQTVLRWIFMDLSDHKGEWANYRISTRVKILIKLSTIKIFFVRTAELVDNETISIALAYSIEGEVIKRELLSR